MTFEQKLGQLQQLDADFPTGKLTDEQLQMVREGRLGSTLNARGAANTNAAQKVAMEESDLKIPLLFGFDVIHGYRTVFPVPLATASSWDPDAAKSSAAVAAREARAAGVHWTFAPMVDIARDPRWGRIVEGAGEDPYLGSAFARAQVEGFQGDDYSQPDRVAATAKHFAAYGGAEAGRDYNTVDVSERRLRELYFPPFKAAVDAGVDTFMTSFNDIGGVPATANKFLLTDVLRNEWGVDGPVISDYTAVQELINHGVAADGADAARQALNAGTDIEMVSRLYNQFGKQLVDSGAVSMDRIDEAVRRVLRFKYRLGLFDDPYVDESLESRELLSKANLKEARRVAGRSMVLLRNEGGALPLLERPERRGRRRAARQQQGGHARHLDRRRQGRRRRDGRAGHAPPVRQTQRHLRPGLRGRVHQHRRLRQRGRRGAQAAQATVVVLGEPWEWSGEASSRSDISLPGKQQELVQQIAATGKPYVVVLMNGRPLTINWLAENAPAVLEAWYPGHPGGPRGDRRADRQSQPRRQAAGDVPAQRRPDPEPVQPAADGSPVRREKQVHVEVPRLAEHAALPVRLRPELHDVRALEPVA